MKDFRFLLSREWLGYFAFLVVFAIVCVMLSNWQFSRGQEAAERNASIAANWDATPQPLSSIMAFDSVVDDSTRYHPVQITGTYLQAAALLVRNRTHNGQAGFEQIVPIRDAATGQLFVVSRGWIISDAKNGVPASVPSPPSGTVTVVARLNAGEQSLGRQSPAGQIASIALGDVSEFLADQGITDPLFTGGYGLLVTETPAASASLVLADPPSYNEGMHWSYAIQWVAFAVLGAIGFVYALRTTRRQQREDAEEPPIAEETDSTDPIEATYREPAGTGANYRDSHQRERRRPRKIDEDSAYEDAILESANRD